MNPQEKLTKLRQLLKNQQGYAFLVPTSDAFQNEYRSAADERLAWLTGFDGSAGLGIITLEKAAVFVDGRYTLQLQNQIDSTLFEGLPIDQRNDWLKDNIPANAVVFYDPWLFNYSELKTWQARANEVPFELRATAVNFIDSLWSDRPQNQPKQAFLHDIVYAGSAFLDKREALINYLNQKKADVLLIGNSESLNWLLNIRGYDLTFTPIVNMYGLFHKNGSIDVFCDAAKISRGLADTLAPDVTFHDKTECESFITQKMTRKTVLFDTSKTPVALISFLNGGMNTLIPSTDPCIKLRSVKNPTELRGFRQSHRRDGVALVNFLAWLSEQGPLGNLTEIDAADYLENCRKSQDLFHSLSFSTIAGYGANGAIVHYHATADSNATIKPNNLLLIDSGGQYLDGTTDVTRTIAIGKPSAEQCSYFTRVLKGHIALAQAVFPPKTTGAQLDVLARQFLWQIGLDYNHGTGHGVGSFMNVHEGPQGISRSGTSAPLEVGMVLSNEPGYYKTGCYGIRIENLVTVVEIAPATEHSAARLGFETLTLVPIDRSLIQKKLLTEDEIDWLNSYHTHVYTHLSAHLNAKNAKWLAHATKPL